MTDDQLPDDVAAAVEAREALYRPLWAAQNALHAAAEHGAALIARHLYGETAAFLTFDYDGDSDGTWLIPDEVYDADGAALTPVDSPNEDALTDALSAAVRDLYEAEALRIDVPNLDGRWPHGIVIADTLTPPAHPEHVECADGCGLDVDHDGACLDRPDGRVVCTHRSCERCGEPIADDDPNLDGLCAACTQNNANRVVV